MHNSKLSITFVSTKERKEQLKQSNTMALIKGTSEYKKAQELANEISRVAGYQRWNDNTSFNMFFEPFYRFIMKVKELGVFASKIAETIDNQANPYGYQIARVSDKQAWILACAAVENNISFE